LFVVGDTGIGELIYHSFPLSVENVLAQFVGRSGESVDGRGHGA
jgi:hypothetical protein